MGQTALRELKRSPKKSAILGLMCLVALYYWVPLVRGWFGGAPDEAAAAASFIAAAPADPELTKTFKKSTPWNKLRRWMKEDQRMQSADPPKKRHPFQAYDAFLAGLAKSNPEETPKAAKLESTPTTLGLVLQSTVVGGERSTALINERSFVLGSAVKVRVADGAEDIVFRLVDVGSNYAVLQRDGKQYALRLQSQSLDVGDWVQVVR